MFEAGCVRTLKIQEIVVSFGHGLVTARGGRVRVERSKVTARSLHVAGYAERSGFHNVQAGDKAERSEVWVTVNESRAKRGVDYAMLVCIICKFSHRSTAKMLIYSQTAPCHANFLLLLFTCQYPSIQFCISKHLRFIYL